jgi:hypothetical protein
VCAARRHHAPAPRRAPAHPPRPPAATLAAPAAAGAAGCRRPVGWGVASPLAFPAPPRPREAAQARAQRRGPPRTPGCAREPACPAQAPGARLPSALSALPRGCMIPGLAEPRAAARPRRRPLSQGPRARSAAAALGDSSATPPPNPPRAASGDPLRHARPAPRGGRGPSQGGAGGSGGGCARFLPPAWPPPGCRAGPQRRGPPSRTAHGLPWGACARGAPLLRPGGGAGGARPRARFLCNPARRAPVAPGCGPGVRVGFTAAEGPQGVSGRGRARAQEVGRAGGQRLRRPAHAAGHRGVMRPGASLEALLLLQQGGRQHLLGHDVWRRWQEGGGSRGAGGNQPFPAGLLRLPPRPQAPPPRAAPRRHAPANPPGPPITPLSPHPPGCRGPPSSGPRWLRGW